MLRRMYISGIQIGISRKYELPKVYNYLLYPPNIDISKGIRARPVVQTGAVVDSDNPR